MLEIIVKYWVQWACGIGAAAIAAAFRYLLKRQKASDARQRATELGIQALLRDRIIQSYNHYTEKGWMPIYARDSLDACYNSYEALGENGVIDDLMEQLRELPNHKGPGGA